MNECFRALPIACGHLHHHHFRAGSGNPETAHRAKLATIDLFQISRTICTRERQYHDQCPLRESCWTVRKEAESGGPEAVRLPIEALPPQRLHLG